MAEIQTIIGSLPVLRGEYDAATSYYRDNQVTMYGSTFQSTVDENEGFPPAEVREDGKVYAINTDKWVIVANAIEAYNAGERIEKLAENTEIKDEEGNTIPTPFHEIETPEFIHCVVDADEHFLFGIRQDGSVEWAVGIPTPIQTRLQEIVSNITSSLETKVDKEEGKSLIEDEVKECFRVIENEEYIHAITDSEDRLLFGIKREDGKPCFPQNDMYHIRQNEEFLAVWLDEENHVLFGIRRDGYLIGNFKIEGMVKAEDFTSDEYDDFFTIQSQTTL